MAKIWVFNLDRVPGPNHYICPWYDTTVIHSQLLIIILHPIVLKPNTHWNQCYQHTLLGKYGAKKCPVVLKVVFEYFMPWSSIIDYFEINRQRARFGVWKYITQIWNLSLLGTIHAHSETSTRRRKLLCTYSTCFFHQKRQKRSKIVHAPL